MKKEMRKDYKDRVERNKDVIQDNSLGQAGSSMKWWCRHCGEVSDARPESYNPAHYDKPKTVCAGCQEMIDKGVSFKRGKKE